MLSTKQSKTFAVIVVLALSALACSVCALGGGGYLLANEVQSSEGVDFLEEEAPTPEIITTPAPESASDTVEALDQTIIPPRDQLDLALRLRGLSPDDIIPPEPKTYEVGDTELFWVDNEDTDEVVQVTAVLQLITPHAYMWVEEGAAYDPDGLAASAERFNEVTYPTNHQYFGTEWSPGIDGDERLHILHTSAMGNSVAGYFYSPSEYPASAVQYSNEREMFFINISNTFPGSPFYDGVLAHEFQHMIHWNVDRNEESWVNEGLSELAVLLNDLGTDGAQYFFIINTDIQLTDWPSDAKTPHYGAAYLFHTYFLERFGDETLRALVRNPANGMDGVDATLAELGVTDPLTGELITADDVFADWVIANFANDPALGDGRYAYSLLPGFREAEAPDIFRRLPAEDEATVHQFGTDYIQLPTAERLRIVFDGSQQVQLLPTSTGETDGDPDTRDHFVWWSNRGDDSDMTLTTRLDLTGLTDAAVMLEYDVWYLIEENWDYAYVMVSEDDGQTWTVLETPYTTTLNPHGTSYGPGYTGLSANQPGASAEDWLHEALDLGDYAGSEILLRFEMITDDAVNQPGLAVDNIRVEAVGFYDDAETQTEVWQAEGFVRHDNVLPQSFAVQVLALGDTPVLERLELDEANHGELLFEPGPGVDQVVLVVSGLTPHTNELASYRFAVTGE